MHICLGEECHDRHKYISHIASVGLPVYMSNVYQLLPHCPGLQRYRINSTSESQECKPVKRGGITVNREQYEALQSIVMCRPYVGYPEVHLSGIVIDGSMSLPCN